MSNIVEAKGPTHFIPNGPLITDRPLHRLYVPTEGLHVSIEHSGDSQVNLRVWYKRENNFIYGTPIFANRVQFEQHAQEFTTTLPIRG